MKAVVGTHLPDRGPARSSSASSMLVPIFVFYGRLFARAARLPLAVARFYLDVLLLPFTLTSTGKKALGRLRLDKAHLYLVRTAWTVAVGPAVSKVRSC